MLGKWTETPSSSTVPECGAEVKRRIRPKTGIIDGFVLYWKKPMIEKHREPVEPSESVETRATEISVANGRAVEPFVKTFSFSPENITQEPLGALVGVFSVSDRSESSAYTVNIIAAVAKKEYYANPHRGSIESFELMLHRVNLSLSEMVNRGKMSWIGNLHGAMAVIDGDIIHFSVTGSGKVLLFRDQGLQDIGDGLASEEAASHPIKTFLEISSGRLVAGDCILLTTHEPLTLFSLRELERNGNRLIPEGKFTRFLETAMRNELRTGAVVAIDVRETDRKPKPETGRNPKPKVTDTEPMIPNVWSDTIFNEFAKKNADAVAEPYHPEDTLVDRPTTGESAPVTGPVPNEIRIQGEVPENNGEHPMQTHIRWILEDGLYAFRNGMMRMFRHMLRKGTAATEAVSISFSTASESFRNRRSDCETTPRSKPTPSETPAEAVPLPGKNGFIPSAKRLIDAKLPIIVSEVRRFLVRQARPAMETAYHALVRVTMKIVGRCSILFVSAWKRFQSLPQKHRLIIAVSMAFLLIGSVVAIGKRVGTPETVSVSEPNAPETVMDETPEKESFPPTGERNARLAHVSPIPASEHDIVTPVYLGTSLFLVTATGVVDAADGTVFTIPTSDTVSLGAGMADIGTIFLLTERDELYSFTPSNGVFTKNAIIFPDGFKAVSMGDFLTYLYFLEKGTGNVYRYPRADGGFGDGSLWTKKPLSAGMIAVDGNLYGSDGSSLTAFAKGVPIDGFSDRKPTTPRTITTICANGDAPDRLVILDAPAKRVILMGPDETIVSQHFHESFSSATACALSGDGTSVAVSGGTHASTIRVTE